jgi:hypothetical protein
MQRQAKERQHSLVDLLFIDLHCGFQWGRENVSEGSIYFPGLRS